MVVKVTLCKECGKPGSSEGQRLIGLCFDCFQRHMKGLRDSIAAAAGPEEVRELFVEAMVHIGVAEKDAVLIASSIEQGISDERLVTLAMASIRKGADDRLD